MSLWLAQTSRVCEHRGALGARPVVRRASFSVALLSFSSPRAGQGPSPQSPLFDKSPPHATNPMVMSMSLSHGVPLSDQLPQALRPGESSIAGKYKTVRGPCKDFRYQVSKGAERAASTGQPHFAAHAQGGRPEPRHLRCPTRRGLRPLRSRPRRRPRRPQPCRPRPPAEALAMDSPRPGSPPRRPAPSSTRPSLSACATTPSPASSREADHVARSLHEEGCPASGAEG
jgi:hypothetical protein